MKRLRLLLLAAGAGLLLLLALVVVALTPSFQTWAARRAVAARPELRATVGSVAAGMSATEIRDLRIDFKGVVVALPLVELEVPVASASWSRTVIMSRLAARGWTMEFAQPASIAATSGPPAGAVPGRVSAEAAVQAFVGVFAQLQLPVDIALDGVDLEGDVILPEKRGRVHVTVKGGGLAAGRDAKFEVTATAALAADAVKSVDLRGELTARMDTPRTFTALGVRFDSTAVGSDIPGGARLHAEAAATRGSKGESYSAIAVTEGREVIRVTAEFPTGAPRIDGRWSARVRDADLVPFTFGRPLPVFAVSGEGTFDSDPGFVAVHLAGRIDATVDRLEVLRRELAVLGPLAVKAEFDLAQRAGAIAARKFEASLGAGGPIAALRLLQEFEINPGTGELRTAESAQELFALMLQGAPLAWFTPWLDGFELGPGRVQGELFAKPSNGGVTLRSRAPLAIDEIGLARGGRPLLEKIALLVSIAADYTPQGWQVEIPGLTAKVGDETLLTFEARAGRLLGKGEPIKATGRLLANLPRVFAQPFAAGSLALATGDIDINFAASSAVRHEMQAIVAVKNLAALVEGKPVALPSLALEVRTDAAVAGQILLSAPLVMERDGRNSDLTLTGVITPVVNQPPVIEAHVTSTQFYVEDVQSFVVAVPSRADAKPAVSAPPWAGFNGSISLRLKDVIYSPALRASNVTGRVRLDAGKVKLEGLQAGLGGPGRAEAEGAITFDASSHQPYALAADLRVRDFEIAPFLRALDAEHAAIVEGRFEVESTLAARAPALSSLLEVATGEFRVTSKGGQFRGLPVSIKVAAESAGRISSLISSIGGRKTPSEIGGKAEAVTEFVRALHPINYDQLSVLVTRDAAFNTTLKNFTLIAPELRLTGSGCAKHQAGTRLLDEALTMEFRLRARGRQGELLKYLGVLETKADSLGYLACSLPFKIGGTLSQPDASDPSVRLAALALEKTGVTERASEFFNKLIGGAK